jgi:hypothetical protein
MIQKGLLKLRKGRASLQMKAKESRGIGLGESEREEGRFYMARELEPRV